MIYPYIMSLAHPFATLSSLSHSPTHSSFTPLDSFTSAFLLSVHTCTCEASKSGTHQQEKMQYLSFRPTVYCNYLPLFLGDSKISLETLEGLPMKTVNS